MFVYLSDYGHLFNEVEAWFGSFLQLLAMREPLVVPYNFKHSGANEEAKQEVTSQQTKELQRQFLPLMRKKDEL